MTRTQRILGLSGICLLLSGWAGCYFNTESGLEPTAGDRDGDGWEEGADCDDSNPAVYPGADEICGDGIDNDCDKELDFEDAECQVGGQGGNGQGAGGAGQGGDAAGGTGGAGQGGDATGGMGGAGQGGDATGGMGGAGQGGDATGGMGQGGDAAGGMMGASGGAGQGGDSAGGMGGMGQGGA